MSAGALAKHFDMTKPTVSHHFSVLKEADLIVSRREGQQIMYRLTRRSLKTFWRGYGTCWAAKPKLQIRPRNAKHSNVVSG